MTTATQRRTRPTTAKPTADAPAQTEQPSRPAIWLQVVTANGATQPAAISIEHPDWEMALDSAVNQIKLIVLREQLAQMRKA